MPAADVIVLVEFDIDPTYQVLKYGNGYVSVNVTDTGTIKVTATPVGSNYFQKIKALDKDGNFIAGIDGSDSLLGPQELSFNTIGDFILLVEFYELID